MSDSDVQPLVTQCPNCHTQFRVSESQLQVAGGKVRCGACLTVFQGVDNLVWDGGEAPAEADPATDEPADLDGLLDDIDAVEPAAEDTAAPTAADAQTQDDAPANAQVPSDPETETSSVLGVAVRGDAHGDVAAAAPVDEATRDGVLEDTEAVEAPPRRTLEITLDELEAQLLSDDPLELPKLDELEAGAAADEEELIPGEELEAAKRSAREAATAAESPEREDEITPAEAAGSRPSEGAAAVAEVEAAAGAGEPVADEPVADEPLAEEAEAVSLAPAADDPFAQLREDPQPEPDDPFERLAAKQREAAPALPSPGRSVWPTVGIAAGVLLLVAQVLFLRFGTWTQNPQIRPVYEVVCAALPCTVPPLKALKYMEVVKKNARTHPSVANALQIDLLIANRAPFAQAFPLLEIVFTDLNNDVVAGRRFKPSEYLAGELMGQTEIPAQTPVRVQLEIEDLGEDAINYNITFR
ncbi:MAG: DUF3426 domain-containing protein [Pseudomonadota bacterium]